MHTNPHQTFRNSANSAITIHITVCYLDLQFVLSITVAFLFYIYVLIHWIMAMMSIIWTISQQMWRIECAYKMIQMAHVCFVCFIYCAVVKFTWHRRFSDVLKWDWTPIWMISSFFMSSISCGLIIYLLLQLKFKDKGVGIGDKMYFIINLNWQCKIEIYLFENRKVERARNI